MMGEPIGFDWRFLPGVPASGKALIFYYNRCQPAEGLRAVFEQVITMSEKLSMKTTCPDTDVSYLQASGDLPPFVPQSFDLIAFPDGFLESAGSKLSRIMAQMDAARRLLRPGGALYLGFSNSWGYARFTAGFRRGQFHTTLPGIKRALHHAGFRDNETYAMLPNHTVPVYISPLRSETLGFTLSGYLRRRRRGAWLRHFIRPGMARWLRWLLPGYGIVAKAAA